MPPFGDRLALATRKGLLIVQLSDYGDRLLGEHHVGARVSYAMRDPRSGALYSCLDHGHWGCKLQRSRDEGETWQEIPAPKYPEGSLLKPDKPAVLLYQWCLTAAPADQPGRLYLGTVPGGLFVSEDEGDSWRLVESLWNHPSRLEHWFGGGMNEPGIHSILIDPRDSRKIAVGISCAGMFVSDDDGASWSPRNRGCQADFLPNPEVEVGHDPHLIVQSRADPDVYWQQNHCGVFRTADAGLTWTPVSTAGNPVHFGFAVAADPHDARIAWVVPAQSDEVRVAVGRALFVARTDDAGGTWRFFRAGLPQENCYDFVFRHGLDLHENRLALGTAGGALFISRDRGESWETIGDRLPPIYSVRFI